ncbi:chromosome partitioning protein (plasmid) [Amycolatopsis keratiniphila]|uniref:Chromosome partitioning protein n=1 Tax=Amycolatopsis keratiniphila TaxID=129921 RepID=W6HZJ5_9PSEU|nr:chromosome partitioning protein [Amycolatopsis keratiniphila]
MGKTNEVINVAVFLVVMYGLRVRVIDLDPQADSSAALGFEVDTEEDAPSVYDAITDAYARQRLVTGTAARAIQECRWDVPWKDKLTFIPSRFDLEEANQVAPNLDYYLRLRAALEGTDDDVDVTLYDCPPSLGVLPQMAWADSDDVMLVTQPSFRSYRGLRRTQAQLYYVKDKLLVPDLDVVGYVINGARDQTKNHQHWTKRIISELGEDRHWGTVPLRATLSRLDDQLKAVEFMDDSAEKEALKAHYKPIVHRIHTLATTTINEEI